MRRLLVALVTCLALTSASAQPTGMWTDEFAPPNNLDRFIYAMVADEEGHLIVGGDLELNGLSDSVSVAKWDGVSWKPLGGGFNGDVSELAFDAAGVLYAGGNFTEIDGQTIYRIAYWDGSSWNAVGEGVSANESQATASVNAIVFDDAGNLYAGGSFTRAGGAMARGLARWDGTSWHEVGGGVDGSLCGDRRLNDVFSLLYSNGLLYVAGNFDTVGGVPARDVAVWDGSEWHSLNTSDYLDYCNGVYALAMYQDILHIGGGSFGLARMENNQWVSVGYEATFKGLVFDIAVHKTGLYVAGGVASSVSNRQFNAARFYQGVWEPLGDGIAIPGFLSDIVVSANSVYVGGTLFGAGSGASSGIGRWIIAEGTQTEAPLPERPTAALHVYPNPAASYVEIRIEGRVVGGTASVEVVNSLGQRVAREVVATDGTPLVMRVDTSPWVPGLYLVVVRDAHGHRTQAFVKR